MQGTPKKIQCCSLYKYKKKEKYRHNPDQLSKEVRKIQKYHHSSYAQDSSFQQVAEPIALSLFQSRVVLNNTVMFSLQTHSLLETP